MLSKKLLEGGPSCWWLSSPHHLPDVINIALLKIAAPSLGIWRGRNERTTDTQWCVLFVLLKKSRGAGESRRGEGTQRQSYYGFSAPELTAKYFNLILMDNLKVRTRRKIDGCLEFSPKPRHASKTDSSIARDNGPGEGIAPKNDLIELESRRAGPSGHLFREHVGGAGE